MSKQNLVVLEKYLEQLQINNEVENLNEINVDSKWGKYLYI